MPLLIQPIEFLLLVGFGSRADTGELVFAMMLVCTIPGQMVLTPMPDLANSARRQSENMNTAALLVE